jgi:hypothetical protein
MLLGLPEHGAVFPDLMNVLRSLRGAAARRKPVARVSATSGLPAEASQHPAQRVLRVHVQANRKQAALDALGPCAAREDVQRSGALERDLRHLDAGSRPRLTELQRLLLDRAAAPKRTVAPMPARPSAAAVN